MSKKEIATRMVRLGFRIGKFAKDEIEKEAKFIVKKKMADKKTAKKYAKMVIAEARKMKAKLEAYAKAEMKKSSINLDSAKKSRKKKK